MDEISKKDLLTETGISYGQLYRWKREGLIPEEWFVKRASFTGQETWFPRERVLERVGLILDMKDEESLEGIRRKIIGEDDGELGGLIKSAVMMAGQDKTPAQAVLFETNDGKHFILLTKDGRALADGGVKPLMMLTEKEISNRIKAEGNAEARAEGNAEVMAEGNAEAMAEGNAEAEAEGILEAEAEADSGMKGVQ